MSRFQYTAVGPGGERLAGVVRTASRRDAIATLLGRGVHPIRVREQASPSAGGGLNPAGWWGRVRAKDLAVFSRQLAALLKAGLPMVQAIATLRQQTSRPKLAGILEDIEAALTTDAMSLAEAMAQHPRVFDPVCRGLIHAGEEGGRLSSSLEQLSTYLSRSAKLRSQVVGAFVYPLVLLTMGLLAVMVLLTFVIPKFEKLFGSFGQELPWVTRLLMQVGSALATGWWAGLLGLGLLLWAAVSVWRRPTTRRAVDRLLLSLPVAGPLITKLEVARLSRTLAALLDGGVRIVPALQITAEAVGNRVVRAAFTPITHAVATGQEIGPSMADTQLFPPLALNLIRTGEGTGELSSMLRETAEIFEDETQRAVDAAVKLLEPALIVAMGLVITGIVAAVMLPIFQTQAITS